MFLSNAIRLSAVISVVAVGCGGEGTDDSGTDDSDTHDSDTDMSCSALMDGPYNADGASMGMTMGTVLTMDAVACTFTLTEWDMVMGSIPDSGSIDGDTVTLGGEDAYWSSCTGTVDANGMAASGVCDDDGADWSLTMDSM